MGLRRRATPPGQGSGPSTGGYLDDILPFIKKGTVIPIISNSLRIDQIFRNEEALTDQIAEAAEFDDDPGAQMFQDVVVGSTFYDFIQRLAHRSIINGYACGGSGEPCVAPGNLSYFRPLNNATRGQTSKIVAIAFFPACAK